MIVIIAILIFIIIGVLIFSSGILISKQKERWFILLGILMIVGAFVFPITTLLWNKAYSVKEVAALGAYGDFFGGTTVGLLSIAGASFLVASIFLQMKSNNIQKAEMVKTNEQLDLQRKEFETTNITMIKQSFDSTFFNMLNLQHAILNDIEFVKGDKVYKSRQAFRVMYKELENMKIEIIKKQIFKWIMANEQNFWEFEKARSKYNYIQYSNRNSKNKFIINEKDLKRVRNKMKEEKEALLQGIDVENWVLKWKEYDYNEEKNKYFGVENSEKERRYLYNQVENNLLQFLVFLPKENVIRKYYENSKSEITLETRWEIYKRFYDEYEYLLAHYYKNLYRIVKYLEKYEFDSNNSKKNEEEKRNYRGILRAQFSSYEFILLYFNLEYCSAGEKFKKVIENKGFFDETLMNEDLMWKNNNF